MVMVKKSAGNSGGAPSLDILAAKLRIVEAELSLEEREVNLDNGRTFMAEPNLNVKIEVVANMVDPGVDEGVRFYDRFKLKKDDDGEWSFAKYSKLGNLIIVRYGEDWFDDPRAEFEEADFEDYKVRKGEYRARCPAHNGNSNDSLSIKEGDDGRALLTCHAHCETEDILE